MGLREGLRVGINVGFLEVIDCVDTMFEKRTIVAKTKLDKEVL